MRAAMVFCAFLVFSAPVAAQTASIEGDVYLLMKSGDTKKGSGRTVALVPLSGEFGDARANICRALQPRLDYLLGPYADSVVREIQTAERKKDRIAVLSFEGKQRALMEQLMDSTGALFLDLIAKETRTSAGSGMNAHYRFASVEPGLYALYSEWTISDNDYAWWAPIVVGPSAAIVRDLDNSVEFSTSSNLTLAVCTVKTSK